MKKIITKISDLRDIKKGLLEIHGDALVWNL
jgi:hypothetical protein